MAGDLERAELNLTSAKVQSSLKMSGSYCFKLSGHLLFNC